MILMFFMLQIGFVLFHFNYNCKDGTKFKKNVKILIDLKQKQTSKVNNKI
jgi:hypothetical protein